MEVLASLQRRFGFTRSEITVILLLSISLLCGLVVRTLQASPPGGTVPRENFAADDSTYRSRLEASSDSMPTPPIAPRATGGKSETHGKPAPPQAGVNINTAGAGELVALPGVGPAIAERIVEYRKQHGRFTSLDQIANVKGIGPKKLEKMRPIVRLRDKP